MPEEEEEEEEEEEGRSGQNEPVLWSNQTKLKQT